MVEWPSPAGVPLHPGELGAAEAVKRNLLRVPVDARRTSRQLQRKPPGSSWARSNPAIRSGPTLGASVEDELVAPPGPYGPRRRATRYSAPVKEYPAAPIRITAEKPRLVMAVMAQEPPHTDDSVAMA
jgi:hypothetical protein